MLRARIIKPGIMTNEKLAALGPYATLLFERLWMMADREGRLEYRPARIHAEAFPYWPDVPVEKLCEDLCKSGFIQLYSVRAKPSEAFLAILKFSEHQSIHPHEKRSVLPDPPSTRNGRHLKDANVITSKYMSRKRRDMSRNDSDTSTSTSTSIKEVLRRNGRESERNQNEDPPPPPPSVKKPQTQKRREPGMAQAATQASTAPSGERASRSVQAEPVNFWPHSAEGVEWVRGLLTEIAREARLPPPDDEILRRALDAGRGASAEDIYRVLRHRWQRGRFRSMHSWGLLPLVVGSAFRAA